jgi:hypothetical protein
VTAPETTAPVVLRDVFPALVAVDGAPTYRNARAIITRDRVFVYLTTAGPVLDAPYDPAESVVPRYNAPSRQRTAARLSSGATVTVERQRGCGCGNPLKGWHPWHPWQVAQ